MASQPESRLWRFDADMRVITHEDSECAVCDPWIAHFALASARHNVTLAAAERQRDAALFGRTPADSTTIDTLRRDRDDWRRQYGLKCDQVRDLQEVVARLRADISSLHDRSCSPRRRKSARHRGPSMSPARTSSRTGSPMRVDRARGRSPPPSRPLADPRETHFHAPSAHTPGIEGGLLSRLSVAPRDSRPFLPQDDPSINVEGGLLSCLSVASPGAPDRSVRIAPFPPTPISPSVGFPALLPVICQTVDADKQTHLHPGSDSVQRDAAGAIDFKAHDHFVFADGGFVNGRPAWLTHLVTQSFFTSTEAVLARASHVPLPLRTLTLGGRNGVLISDTDPTDPTVIERLITTPGRGVFAAAFINRIRYTPPELREDVHIRALKRWRELRREHEQNSERPLKAEPQPRAPVDVWKVWLKKAYEASTPGYTYKYRGIPCVGLGYSTMHIEGAMAVLKFVPITKKYTTMKGSPRDFLLCAIAMIGCVPGRYQKTMTQLGITTTKIRSSRRYDTEAFGPFESINMEVATRYMASVGVTTEEVERWRPWAAAYVDMEIDEQPNSTHTGGLKDARDMARMVIDSDHSLSLKRVNVGVPGHYNPTAGARAARCARPERASSSTPAMSPAFETQPPPVDFASDIQPPPMDSASDKQPPPNQLDHEGDIEPNYQDCHRPICRMSLRAGATRFASC
jgi:hypothetical protein